MASRTNRHGNNRQPKNIWTGEKSRQLRDTETLCDGCEGRGGHRESEQGNAGLIKMCSKCNGRGYHDWIHKATDDEIEKSFFIVEPYDDQALVAEKGEEDKIRKMIELQVTGQFKFVDKDEI